MDDISYDRLAFSEEWWYPKHQWPELKLPEFKPDPAPVLTPPPREVIDVDAIMSNLNQTELKKTAFTWDMDWNLVAGPLSGLEAVKAAADAAEAKKKAEADAAKQAQKPPTPQATAPPTAAAAPAATSTVTSKPAPAPGTLFRMNFLASLSSYMVFSCSSCRCDQRRENGSQGCGVAHPCGRQRPRRSVCEIEAKE
jgi:hypothetical protein